MAKKRGKRGRKTRPLILNLSLIFLTLFLVSGATYLSLEYFNKKESKVALVSKTEPTFKKQELLAKEQVAKKEKIEKVVVPKKETTYQSPKIEPVADEKPKEKELATNPTKEENATFEPKEATDLNLTSTKSKTFEPNATVEKNATLPKKGKLAIIIDDVMNERQVKLVKASGILATLSFFPPTNSYPNTPKLAKQEPFYMIHLPLEAMDYNHQEPGVLNVGDSLEKIDKTVAKIRANFPAAKFINNHTGSKFTKDRASMQKLLATLQKYNFSFIDSRTIMPNAVKSESKRLSMPYIYRDIFLDHTMKKSAIEKKVKEAVELAKKRGYAIAIGHPKSLTLEVLKNSKPLLEEIELVYVGELYEFYK